MSVLKEIFLKSKCSSPFFFCAPPKGARGSKSHRDRNSLTQAVFAWWGWEWCGVCKEWEWGCGGLSQIWLPRH